MHRLSQVVSDRAERKLRAPRLDVAKSPAGRPESRRSRRSVRRSPPGRAARFASALAGPRHRPHSGDHRGARHQNRTHRLRAPSSAPPWLMPGTRSLGKVTSRIAFATATPIAMIAPMNDDVERRIRQPKHRYGPRRRRTSIHRKRQPERLEVGQPSRKMTPRNVSPSQPAEHSSIGCDLPAQRHVHPVGRFPVSLIAFRTPAPHVQFLAGDIRAHVTYAACCSGRIRRAPCRRSHRPHRAGPLSADRRAIGRFFTPPANHLGSGIYLHLIAHAALGFGQ